MNESQLQATLTVAGFAKTVYALVMRETEQVLDDVLDGGDRSALIAEGMRDHHARPHSTVVAITERLRRAREELHEMYREAWTKKQDAMHHDFFECWRSWVAPVVQLDIRGFDHRYPTAGASEGLRATIDAHGHETRASGRVPALHMFAGDYEGYSAYAAAIRARLVTHDRLAWRDTIELIGDDDQIYVSQPSAIDGDIWPDFDEFAATLAGRRPGARIMLDLTYVGSVARPYRIKADHANIGAVFFSLSKPAGVYYHRIGGCLSRRAYPGLYGNLWFKNLLSMRFGAAFMRRFGVRELPQKYAALQHKAVVAARDRLGLAFRESDVILLATAPITPVPSDIEQYLKRGRGTPARLCLTPAMAALARSPEHAGVSQCATSC